MMTQHSGKDKRVRAWKKTRPPKRILAIRLHAIGDVVITLPYLQHLRNMLPSDTRLDLMTIEECAGIPQSLNLFDRVYVIGGGRNFKKQFTQAVLFLPQLLFRRYEVVLDLQDAVISRLVRKLIFPRAWTTFDRFSPIPAGMRTQQTMNAVGIGEIHINTGLALKSPVNTESMLGQAGWFAGNDLVVLNPAGAFETRNWPLGNYVEFARGWKKIFPHTQFLVLGTENIAIKADYFKSRLGENLVNLVGKTTMAQAFALIQRVKLVLTEDSGLMHMAWVSGVATFALFGSTRSDHARPLGDRSYFLDSSDLPCGSCMQELCKYGDTHCLSRYSPEMVLERAVALVSGKICEIT
ncbi:MAG TPA: glycosyltransferase family 9 protein [Puia sp.]|nr:glycosyltransferase family 9 protein [Puia sp.]